MLVGGCNKTPTLEESVAGEYEPIRITFCHTFTYSLNYPAKTYHTYESVHLTGENSRRKRKRWVVSDTGLWTIKDGELHCKSDKGITHIFSIDKNPITGESGYITSIANIGLKGKRRDEATHEQRTWRRKRKPTKSD